MNNTDLILRIVRMNDELHHLIIDQQKGIITAIQSAEEEAGGTSQDGAIDCGGLLYLPAMTDKHVHLDKHFLGEPWRPLQPFVTLPGQLAFEKKCCPPSPQLLWKERVD